MTLVEKYQKIQLSIKLSNVLTVFRQYVESLNLSETADFIKSY